MAVKLSYPKIKMPFATKQIADTLSLSSHTLETFQKNIYHKQKLQEVGELISFACKDNL